MKGLASAAPPIGLDCRAQLKGLTRAVSRTAPAPVIASGGVGNLSDLAAGIRQGQADAAPATGIFHF